MTTSQEFSAERKRIRGLKDDHPDRAVRGAAAVLWAAMEAALPEPDDAPLHVRKALALGAARLAERLAEYETQKAGKGE